MDSIEKDKLVVFGAGRIGRSFIGQLFSSGGYEVVFIDTNKAVTDALNNRGQYKVIFRADTEEVLTIRNVRGIYAGEREKVISEVATAGILAVSVGTENIESLFPVLSEALIMRRQIEPRYALDIIIAENMRNADSCFRKGLSALLPADYPINSLVGLIETSIGKMVPIMTKKDSEEDILQVFAEPYNTLILNRKGFKNPVPSIDGLAPKENMKAWVDRKLFIHNLGHSSAAYIGHLYSKEFIYIHEALEVKDIFNSVRSAMLQSADILQIKYPDEFTREDLTGHIDDLLYRFRNKALGDTIFRVGCDLLRKLGPEDRLAGAIRSAVQFNLPYDRILFALVCGSRFRARDEEGNLFRRDIEFIKRYNNGISYILTDLCGFKSHVYKSVVSEACETDLKIMEQGLF